VVSIRWRESGIGGGRRGWVGMVSLGGNRWKGLCTEWVILNEGRWQAEEVDRARALGRQFSKPGSRELSAWEQCSGGRDAIGVS